MQNRGLIKFFAIIFALVCVYQLSFTFAANSIVNDAKAFAKGDSKKELQYLDSLKREKVFLGKTYKEVTDNQINKGLDLEGGLNVILQISVKDILKGLANETKNPAFNKALADAKLNQQGNQDFIDAFFDEADKAGLKLADVDVFRNKNLDGIVTIGMTNNQVKPIIKQKVNESVESAFKVLRERIDQFGVTQPNIQLLGNSGRILVELPGAKDVDKIRKILQTSAQLEFWIAHTDSDAFGYLIEINEALKKTEIVKKDAPVKTTGIDSLLTDKADSTAVVNPLFDKLQPLSQQPVGSPVIGIAKVKDTALINSYFKRADIKAMQPSNLAYSKFVWEKLDEKNPEFTRLYLLKGDASGKPALAGDMITNTRAEADEFGKQGVSMNMNTYGTREWEKLTSKVAKEQGFIAIVMDNTVYSAPQVNEPITGGSSRISGSFTIEDAQDLTKILGAGKLPATAEIVQSELVGPSLGQEAINNGLISFVLGFSLVLLWMVVYYGKAGFYANLALLVNILFIFGALASFGAVLTLPGIAGIVLTIGMAVDANVIIFERAKEELDNGRTVQEATDYAFTWKGALSSIVDANVTTALTAIILLVFGTGPIKGFATTLLIGIITSVFTAVFVTRMILDYSLARNENLTFSTTLTKNWFKNLNFDFLGKKKLTYGISAILVVLSLISLFTKGLNPGIDFVGGRTYQVRFDKPVVSDEVTKDLSAVFGEAGAEVKKFGSDNQLKITTKYKVDEEGDGIDKEVNVKLFEGLKKNLPANLTYEQFANLYEGKTVGILSSAKVTGTVSKDIKTNSLWAVMGSLLVVFIYLMVTFRKWQFGFAAVVAVTHDIIIVLGIFSFFYNFLPFNMELDQAFIAAILTVIGYSLNDTVIVFDRVREYLNYNSSPDFKGLVNKALNTTLSRTVNTSATTLVVLVSIFILGGETIRGFVFAILVGILVGTYSSLFVATPLMADAIGEEEGRKMAEFKKED